MAPEEAEPTMMAETTTTTMDAAMDTEAEAGSEETAEGPALRHAQPRFDYSIGKEVHDHHFTHTKRLSGEETERLKALGLTNPPHQHVKEGLISHSAQRALLRSLDHANQAHEEEAMELGALMAEFDALVAECGAMKTRLEHEHYKTAPQDCGDLHARLVKLQAATKHALVRAEREAALWRGVEHKKEMMHQHVAGMQQQQQQKQEAPVVEEVPVAAAAMGEN